MTAPLVLLTVPEICQQLRCGRSEAYRVAREIGLKIGRSWRVRAERLEQYQHSLHADEPLFSSVLDLLRSGMGHDYELAGKTEDEWTRYIARSANQMGVGCRTLVKCSVGVADIVDRDCVYELKIQRAEFLKAVGQALMYGVTLRKRPCVVMGHAPSPEHIAAAKKLRVAVLVWGPT